MLMRITNLVATVMFLLGATACSHNKIALNAGASNEGDGKGLAVRMFWIKPKGKAVDLELTLTNNYDHPVSFMQSAMRLTFNGVIGALGTNEFSGEMAAHSAQTGLIVFKYEPKVPISGTAVFAIDPIYNGENVALSSADSSKKLAPLQINIPVR